MVDLSTLALRPQGLKGTRVDSETVWSRLRQLGFTKLKVLPIAGSIRTVILQGPDGPGQPASIAHPDDLSEEERADELMRFIRRNCP